MAAERRRLLVAVLLSGLVSGCVQPTPAGPWGLGFAGPAPPPATLVSATPGAETDPLRRTMVAAVNRERLAHGLAPLRLDAALDRAAQAHAVDMARRGVLSHRGADGSDAGQRLVWTGYRYRAYGENIAQGQQSVAEVVAAWMASRTHRRTMLDPGFADLGVGYALGRPAGDTPGDYWVIVLGVR